jgi:Fic family protein
MAEQGMLEILKQINDNILALKKLKELEMREVVTREIERIASTSVRKKMWVLSDGTKTTDEISRIINVSKRAVQYFVQECLNSGLLGVDKRGYPVRRIEWVPPEWTETALLKEPSEKETQEVTRNEQARK